MTPHIFLSDNVDVNTAVPVVDQPDEAEVLATRPMSYVLAVDNGKVQLTFASSCFEDIPSLEVGVSMCCT